MTTKGKGGPVTQEMLDQTADTILEGVSRLLVASTEELKIQLGGLDTRLKAVENGLTSIKEENRVRKASLFDIPSRREFTELKKRVEKLSRIPST